MIYRLAAVTERTVHDAFGIEVEADDPQEAQDLAYEVLSDYPNSELVLNRLLKVDTQPGPIVSITLEFVKDDVEAVFEGNDDDDNGDSIA